MPSEPPAERTWAEAKPSPGQRAREVGAAPPYGTPGREPRAWAELPPGRPGVEPRASVAWRRETPEESSLAWAEGICRTPAGAPHREKAAEAAREEARPHPSAGFA